MPAVPGKARSGRAGGRGIEVEVYEGEDDEGGCVGASVPPDWRIAIPSLR